MKHGTGFRTGIWISLVLAVIDVAGLFAFGVADAPPAGVILGSAALGAVTLLAVRPAVRGGHTALVTVVASRALSALLSIPAYFADTSSAVPAVAATILIALNALAIVLLVPALRSTTVRPAQIRTS